MQKILKAEFLQPEHVILLADEEAVQRRGDRAEHRALAAEEAQDEVERAQLLVLGLPRADGHAHRSRHLLRSWPGPDCCGRSFVSAWVRAW